VTTNVPPIQFLPAGVVVPPEADVLAGALADLQDAFGGQLNESLETPQGQLASSEAAIIADKNAQIVRVVNNVNPDTADGIYQDAIGRIYFMNRSPGAPTAVQCLCIGAAGTTIPIGAQAQDTSGNLYVCTQAGVIGVGGSITLPFANVENGPIPCPSGTLTRIYRSIVGWDTINNPSDGVLGRDVENRAQFEQRRQASVALNAHGSLPSIYAAVFAVPDVIDAYVYENTTNAPINVGSTAYTLVPHSLYAAVVGGAPDAIAQAIWLKKDVGCDYNGNTSVVVVDESGYQPPYPTYTVKYEIPASLPIYFEVFLRDSDSLPADIEVLVKAAIIATFTGEDGGTRVRIGAELLASKFYPGVIAIGPQVSVLSILLGTYGTGPTLTSLLVGIDQAPTVEPADIIVTLVP
jgi:uncharacterized phage protein gp47/JayE